MAFYWLSWIAIIMVGFFLAKNHKLKPIILWILFLNIILIDVQIRFGDFILTLPFVYSSIFFWTSLIFKNMRYFNYFLIICKIFLYLGLRFLLITSPIWLFTNPFIIISSVLLSMLIVLVRSPLDRVYILVLSCLTGEFFYAYHAKSLGWEVIIGESELFFSLYLVIMSMFLLERLIRVPLYS